MVGVFLGALSHLGAIAHERFKDARSATRTKEALLTLLNTALGFYRDALSLLPPDAIEDLATMEAQLGAICADAGQIDVALSHFQNAIRYREQMDDPYGAAQARFNVALHLESASRLADARSYALAALRNFETYGDRAAAEIQKIHTLLAHIDRRLAGQPS